MKKNIALVLISLFLTAAYLMPASIFANGGDQRIVENKYFINLSRAPFTPRVGVKTSMLVSFVDIQKNKLIAEDLIVKVRISKLDGIGSNKRDFLFEKDDVRVQGGVLELPYTFTEAGLQEIFFNFAFVSSPQKVYEVPDFLIDVQKVESPESSSRGTIIGIAAGTILGLIAGWFLGRHRKLV